MDEKSKGTELDKVAKEVVKQKRPKKSEQLQVHTEPGDNTKYITHALEISRLPEIDVTNAKEIGDRVSLYLEICAKNDMKPNVPGMAMAIGCDRGTLWRWSRGEGQGKNKEVRDTVKKAYRVLNIMIEDYMQNGKINPVSGIFLMKNNFAYVDKQDVVITPSKPLGDEPDQKALEERYVDSIVVDVVEEE